MKTIIHVNQHIIKKNKKTKTKTAPLTVKNYKQNRYAKTVKILGPSKLIYSPDKPLSCGATCYIVTESDVILG